MPALGALVLCLKIKNTKPKAFAPALSLLIVLPMKAWWTGKGHGRAPLVKWWGDQFGKTLLPEITPDEIRAKLKTHRSKAAATYNRYLAILSSILDFATRQQEDDTISEQYIDENPCKKVRSQMLNNKIVRYLSDEEKPRLLRAAQTIGGKFYLKVLMALTTGMRKGGMDQLRWCAFLQL